MKFSIITCTYNSEKYLQTNIDSVKNQNFQDFEHIFIDGFSTDGTVDVIKKYQQEFPERIKFFQYSPKGISNAMNKGILHASGEYINHLHADDSFYNNDVLKNVADFIKEKNNPDLIYGKAKFIRDDRSFRIIPHRKIYHKLRHWLLLLTNYIPHQSVFIKKTIFEKYGLFDERYKNSMDYELWLRLSKSKIKSVFLNKTLCNFSVRSDSQSAYGNNMLKENLIIVEFFTQNKVAAIVIKIIQKINFRRGFY